MEQFKIFQENNEIRLTDLKSGRSILVSDPSEDGTSWLRSVCGLLNLSSTNISNSDISPRIGAMMSKVTPPATFDKEKELQFIEEVKMAMDKLQLQMIISTETRKELEVLLGTK